MKVLGFLALCVAVTLFLRCAATVSAQTSCLKKLWTASQNGRRLSRIDARTGDTVNRGGLIAPKGNGLVGLTWSPWDGTMYGLLKDGTLVTIGLQNGVIRGPVGNGDPILTLQNLAGIAATRTGEIYTYHNQDGNAVYRFDKSTGEAIRMFRTNIGNNNVVDLAFHNNGRILYVTDGSTIYSIAVSRSSQQVVNLGTVIFPDNAPLKLAGIAFNEQGKLFGITDEPSNATIVVISSNDSNQLRARFKSSSELSKQPRGGSTFQCGYKKPPSPPPCVFDAYYYVYTNRNGRRRIGYSTTDVDSVNQEVSTPNATCSLFEITFDDKGTVYGRCDFNAPSSLVLVDLASGNTTKLAEYPRLPIPHGTEGGLAFNPVDGYLYTTVYNDDSDVDSRFSLVKIDRTDYAFTKIGASLDDVFHGLAIDSKGNAFATDDSGSLFSVNLQDGTSSRLLWYLDMPGVFRFTRNIAFDSTDTLYGITSSHSAYMILFNVTDTDNVTISFVKETNRAFNTRGGSFCRF